MSAVLNVAIGIYAILGGPLFIVITLLTFVAYANVDPVAIDPQGIFVAMGALLDKPHLLPIALFIFSGYLLAHSGTPKRAVRVAEAFLGFVPGGLAIVAVVTCAFFTSFTGASGVTIIAIGGLLYPILLERNYPERFNIGLLTASGSLGLLFFPSLPVFMVATVYSLSAGTQSVEPEGIFAAGILPGLLMVVVLSGWAIYTGKKHKVASAQVSLKELGAAIRGAIWEVLMPVALIIAFQSGLIGIHEVATFITLYVLLMEVVLYRDIHLLRDMPKLIRESMALVGAIFIILAVVLGMNNYLKDQKVPQMILAMVQSVIDSPILFLMALNVFLLIIGCLMDVFSAIVAVLPLIIPLAETYGVDPLHLCVIFLANLEIGYLTPPVGLNLFISAFHFKKPVLTVYRAVLPAIALLLFCLLVITYVPSLTLAIPRALDMDAQMTSHSIEGGDTPKSHGTDSDRLLDALGSDDDDPESWGEDNEDGHVNPDDESVKEESGDDMTAEERERREFEKLLEDDEEDP